MMKDGLLSIFAYPIVYESIYPRISTEGTPKMVPSLLFTN